MEFKKLDIKKVEEELEILITELKIGDKISVEWIKDFTYNFDLPTKQISEKYFGKLMNLLPKNISEEDIMKAMQVFNDVWNCFPQKIIKGKSPQDKHFDEIDKFNDKDPKTLTEEEKMIQNHFEYAEKHLDGYLDWIGKEIIPKYESYLKKHNADKSDNRMGVVKAFLETCGRYGFFEIGNLHPMFIKEFPDIFSESFIGPKISKEKVSLFLNDFLGFISVYYPTIQ